MARERIVSGESQRDDREPTSSEPSSPVPAERDPSPAVRPRTMSEYVGPEPLDEHETDLEGWRDWWSANRSAFNLEVAMAASEEKRLERLQKPPSSE